MASTLREPIRFCCPTQPPEDATSYNEGRRQRTVAAGRVASFVCQRALRFSQESSSNRVATRPPRSGHVADSLPRPHEAERGGALLEPGARSSRVRQDHSNGGLCRSLTNLTMKVNLPQLMRYRAGLKGVSR